MGSLGIREELVDLGLDQSGRNVSVSRSPGDVWSLLWLSHHRRADDHSEGVEGYGRTVAVGIHYQRRLQDSIVLRVANERLRRDDVSFPDSDRLSSASRVSSTSRS